MIFFGQTTHFKTTFKVFLSVEFEKTLQQIIVYINSEVKKKSAISKREMKRSVSSKVAMLLSGKEIIYLNSKVKY